MLMTHRARLPTSLRIGVVLDGTGRQVGTPPCPPGPPSPPAYIGTVLPSTASGVRLDQHRQVGVAVFDLHRYATARTACGTTRAIAAIAAIATGSPSPPRTTASRRIRRDLRRPPRRPHRGRFPFAATGQVK
jgi:hypothetical protein